MTAPSPSLKVSELAARGRVIAAIKLYRRETGEGLASAKAVVDALSRGTAPPHLSVDPASGSTRSSRRAAAFLAASVLGFVGVAVTGNGLYRAEIAAQWPQASGEIVRLEFVHGSASSPDRVEVEYTFEAAGRVHRGSRISYTLIFGYGFTRAMESRYAAGTKVRVHYDPSDPSSSVLETRIPPLYWIVFVVSLVALFWGLARWMREARRERAAQPASGPASGPGLPS